MARYGGMIFVAVFLLLSCQNTSSYEADQDIRCECKDNNEAHATFKASAGKTKITPDHNLYLGGFSPTRFSEGAHDDLYARCLILECPTGQRLAFVSLDLVGFIRYDVLLVKKELADKKIIDPNVVFIFASHQHSGPDTIGIWGKESVPPLIKSGRDEKYIKEVRQKIVELIRRTAENMEEAQIFFYNKVSAKGFSKNIRIPEELDESLNVIHVAGEKNTIAILVNFGCHPEALSRTNKLITADFPGYLVKKLEEELGGTALFINGLLGGMVSLDKSGLKYRGSSFERAEEVGHKLAERVFESFAEGGVSIEGDVRIQRKIVKVHLNNPVFKEALKLKLIPVSEETYKDGDIYTEISIISLGKLKIVLVPGEMIPGLGLEIKALVKKMAPGNYPMIFGLANDEIGYILPAKDFYSELYKYEHAVSLGSDTSNVICQAIKEMCVEK